MWNPEFGYVGLIAHVVPQIVLALDEIPADSRVEELIVNLIAGLICLAIPVGAIALFLWILFGRENRSTSVPHSQWPTIDMSRLPRTLADFMQRLNPLNENGTRFLKGAEFPISPETLGACPGLRVAMFAWNSKHFPPRDCFFREAQAFCSRCESLSRESTREGPCPHCRGAVDTCPDCKGTGRREVIRTGAVGADTYALDAGTIVNRTHYATRVETYQCTTCLGQGRARRKCITCNSTGWHKLTWSASYFAEKLLPEFHQRIRDEFGSWKPDRIDILSEISPEKPARPGPSVDEFVCPVCRVVYRTARATTTLAFECSTCAARLRIPPVLMAPEAVSASNGMFAPVTAIPDLVLRMVPIPAGVYWGPREAWYDRDRRFERRSYPVEIPKAFWIGQYEVTQEQFEQVMHRNPSAVKLGRHPVEIQSSQEFFERLNKQEIAAGQLDPRSGGCSYIMMFTGR
jgi:hypothetical protein